MLRKDITIFRQYQSTFISTLDVGGHVTAVRFWGSTERGGPSLYFASEHDIKHFYVSRIVCGTIYGFYIP